MAELPEDERQYRSFCLRAVRRGIGGREAIIFPKKGGRTMVLELDEKEKEVVRFALESFEDELKDER